MLGTASRRCASTILRGSRAPGNGTPSDHDLAEPLAVLAIAPGASRSRVIPGDHPIAILDLGSDIASARTPHAISVGSESPMVDDEADSDGSAGGDADDELLDEKYKSLTDNFEDVAIGGLPPIAPDGGFIATGPIGNGAIVPAADPRNFICVRGPCVHYWQRETFYASGNPAETWGEGGLVDGDHKPIRMPRQIDRTCLAHPGTETELTDELVYDCGRWLPMTPRQVRKRDKLRRAYYKKNPDHDPSFVPAERLRRN